MDPAEVFASVYSEEVAAMRGGKDTNVYGAVLQGCVAVLADEGIQTDWRELSNLYHDPLSSFASERTVTLRQVGESIDWVWRRRAPRESHRSYQPHSYDYDRGPSFSHLSEQVATEMKKQRIRRGTKRHKELLVGVKDKAMRYATQIAAEHRDTRRKIAEQRLEKIQQELSQLQGYRELARRSVRIGRALIEASGVQLSPSAEEHMRAALTSYDQRIAEQENQEQELRAATGEDPETMAAAWWRDSYGEYVPNAAIELPGPIGEVLGFRAHGETLEVKKLKPGEYFAIVLGNPRGRFGDARQIREDIAHFFENGTLPRSKTNWY